MIRKKINDRRCLEKLVVFGWIPEGIVVIVVRCAGVIVVVVIVIIVVVIVVVVVVVVGALSSPREINFFSGILNGDTYVCW